MHITRNADRKRASRRFRHLRFEPLEDRRLLASLLLWGDYNARSSSSFGDQTNLNRQTGLVPGAFSVNDLSSQAQNDEGQIGKSTLTGSIDTTVTTTTEVSSEGAFLQHRIDGSFNADGTITSAPLLTNFVTLSADIRFSVSEYVFPSKVELTVETPNGFDFGTFSIRPHNPFAPGPAWDIRVDHPRVSTPVVYDLTNSFGGGMFARPGLDGLFPDESGRLYISFTLSGSSFHKAIQLSYSLIIEERAPAGFISSIEFGGAGNVSVLPDPGTSNPLFDPYRNEYEDTNQDGTPEQKHPVLYAAGSMPVVSAKFKLAQPTAGTYLVRGVGPDAFIFEGSATLQGDTFLAASIVANKALGSQIKIYDDFVIAWELSSDGGSSWTDAGKSSNTLYVSAAQSLSPHPFETVVHLAIANSLGGSAAFPQLIIDAIWSDFSDREVRRIDGNLLFYYGNPATSEPDDNRVVTTEQLLQTGNGQCGSWVQFFLDCLAVNGVAGGLHVRVDAINRMEEMLVKDYDFLGVGHSGVSAYPFLFLSKVTNIANGTAIRPSDVVDRDGIEGQGTDRPLSKFQNHQLALIGGRYYDPSYGVSYGSLAEMEARSIAGFVLAYPKDVLLVEAIVGDVDGLANHNVYIGRAFVARKEDVTRADLQVAYAFPYPLAPSTEMTASSGLSSNPVESGSSNTDSIVEPESDPERGDTSSKSGVYDYIYAAATSFRSERTYWSATRTNPTVRVALVEKVPIRSVTRSSVETGHARSERNLRDNSREPSARDTVFSALEEHWQIEPLFRKSLHSCIGA